MAEPAFVFDGNHDNFSELVLKNSEKGPVVVNYWSPEAGPCLRQHPVLDKILREFNGRLLLVNVNTEREPMLAADYGITSVPTIKIVLKGEVMETLHGYHNEAQLHEVFSRYMARESDRGLEAAIQMYRSGDTEAAIMAITELAMEDADNLRIPLTLAKILMREDRADDAFRVLDSLPPETREERQIGAMHAHLDFTQVAKTADDADMLMERITTDPDDCESRYQLAAVRLLENEVAEALEQLLEIMRRAPDFRRQAGKRGLLGVFKILGDEGALVEQYRTRMASVLH